MCCGVLLLSDSVFAGGRVNVRVNLSELGIRRVWLVTAAFISSLPRALEYLSQLQYGGHTGKNVWFEGNEEHTAAGWLHNLPHPVFPA